MNIADNNSATPKPSLIISLQTEDRLALSDALDRLLICGLIAVAMNEEEVRSAISIRKRTSMSLRYDVPRDAKASAVLHETNSLTFKRYL